MNAPGDLGVLNATAACLAFIDGELTWEANVPAEWRLVSPLVWLDRRPRPGAHVFAPLFARPRRMRCHFARVVRAKRSW